MFSQHIETILIETNHVVLLLGFSFTKILRHVLICLIRLIRRSVLSVNVLDNVLYATLYATGRIPWV